MLFIIITVWFLVSMVFLLGLAVAARHPAQQLEVCLAGESQPVYDGIMTHKAATGHPQA